MQTASGLTVIRNGQLFDGTGAPPIPDAALVIENGRIRFACPAAAAPAVPPGTPTIDARGGTIMPPGVVLQGYTPAGLAAHRAAHTHAVLTALARGVEVPPAVRQELETPGYPATHTDQPGTITC